VRTGSVTVTIYLFAALMFIAFAVGINPWWTVPILFIMGALVLMGLIPRTRQPEVSTEDKYHLHP